MAEKERFVSFVSGGGSTMFEIGRAIQDGKIPGVEFVGVIASNSEIGAIAKAASLDVPHKVINPNDYRNSDGKVDQDGFAEALLEALHDFDPSVVMQNGWLPKTPVPVINALPNFFNQHPGPLPETRGLYGTQPHSAILNFRRLTRSNEGSMVVAQRVAPNFDEGNLVGMAPVPIRKSDTPKRLQRRALPIEHQLQISVLNRFVREELKDIPQKPLFMTEGVGIYLQAARINARKKYPQG